MQEILTEYHSETSIRAVLSKRDGAVMEKTVAVNRREVNSSPVPVCNVQSPPQLASTDHSAMERLIGMLEKVIVSNNQSRPTSGRMRELPHIKGLNDSTCLVYKDPSHSVLKHCRFPVFFT